MIDIISPLKNAWEAMLHPNSMKQMSISEAVKFYYSFALIPGIIVAIIEGILAGPLYGVLWLAIVFIGEVIGLFIDAAVYHFFGKFLFRKFANDYAATFSAATYATAPGILFIWLAPLTFSVSAMVFAIWSFVLLTIYIMRFQKVSGVVSVLSWLVPAVILSIIALLAIAVAISSLNPALASQLSTGLTTTI